MTKAERQKLLAEKLITMQVYERDLREKGVTYIGGVDEVGRGPLAGPVVVACVVMPSMKIKSFRALQTAKSFQQNAEKSCTTV